MTNSSRGIETGPLSFKRGGLTWEKIYAERRERLRASCYHGASSVVRRLAEAISGGVSLTGVWRGSTGSNVC